MAKKREPHELIEILLRQQRMNRPGREDPLEGIEWTGLPEELQDRVYRPPEPKEPMADLLASLREDQGGEPAAPPPPPPRTRGSMPRGAEKAGPPASPVSPAPDAAGEPAPIPPRPPLRVRLSAWLFDVFAFLNKVYEVRAATVVAFVVAATLLAALCFLLGRARQSVTISLIEGQAAVEAIPIVAPTNDPVLEVTDVTGPNATPPAPPAGMRFAIVVASGIPKEQGAAGLVKHLQEAGLAADRPRYYEAKTGFVVLVGAWSSREEATAQLKDLAPVFKKMHAERRIADDKQWLTNTER